MLEKFVWSLSKKARTKRAEFFRRRFDLTSETKILDIGSENGSNINLVLTGTKISPQNVHIADIDEQALQSGKRNFGYNAVLLNEDGKLPFAAGFFDIVYCSSVIEHITVPKEETWNYLLEKEFQSVAWKRQMEFAKEIRRIGKQYFVQTPNRNFFIESHTWLPLVGFLPRQLLLKVMKQTNSYWIKQAIPDFNLLDKNQMAKLFPEAQIVFERKLGMIKSIMAIKAARLS